MVVMRDLDGYGYHAPLSKFEFELLLAECSKLFGI